MKSKIRPSIRRKRLLNKRILIIAIVTPLIITGSIYSVGESCGLPYRDLPSQEVRDIPKETIHPIRKIPKFNIPLSAELQDFTYEKCIQYDVDYIMVLAIMQEESQFQPDLIADGNYGIMQINKSNHKYLRETLGTTDFLDAKQNIEAGIFFLSGIYENNTNPEKILMVYNMGGRIAQGLWDMGRESTGYSRGVMRAMDDIREREIIE